jgi:hypothetical protein
MFGGHDQRKHHVLDATEPLYAEQSLRMGTDVK